MNNNIILLGTKEMRAGRKTNKIKNFMLDTHINKYKGKEGTTDIQKPLRFGYNT